MEHEPWALRGAQARIEEYRMGDVLLQLVLPDGSPVPPGTPVELEQTEHAFNFGGSLCQARLLHRQASYPAYQEHFAQLFNYATIGFYWGAHEKEPNQWNLQEYARESMAWAIGQGMTVRGHPLMWHNTAPAWIADAERDVKEIDGDILEHVRMLVEEYPQVDQWDLYNETPGIRLLDPDNGVRRWVESYGGPGPVTGRLVDAVRAVRPSGFFALNHFSYEDPEYHEQIRYCLTNGVPFDAIGIQSHMHIVERQWSENQMWRTLEEYARYGKPIHLSEVSVLSCEPMTDWQELRVWKERIVEARKMKEPLPSRKSTPEGERYQADFVRDFYTLAFSHPGVEAIIWWSVSDKDAWRGMPAGLLNANGNPKPSYETLDELINKTWRTHAHGIVNPSGLVPMKGFYGKYTVSVKHQGKILTGSFDLLRGRPQLQQVVVK
jgi:GH35 family endo-1,4-beta-xylanase